MRVLEFAVGFQVVEDAVLQHLHTNAVRHVYSSARGRGHLIRERGRKIIGHLEYDPDAELVEQLEDLAELHSQLAVLDVAYEDMAGADEGGKIVLPYPLAPADAPGDTADGPGIFNTNLHAEKSKRSFRKTITNSGAERNIETLVSIRSPSQGAAKPPFSRRDYSRIWLTAALPLLSSVDVREEMTGD